MPQPSRGAVDSGAVIGRPASSRREAGARWYVPIAVVGLVLASPGLGCSAQGAGKQGSSSSSGGSSSSGASSSGASSSGASSSGSSSGASSSGSSGASGSSGSSSVVSVCGNRKIEPGEQCDDGNAVQGDGCSSDCQLEEGWTCPTVGEACRRTVCGDGIKEGTEQCDDGNALPFDGCSADCKVELDCTQGECAGFCGDGIVEAGEECDDGNNLDGDGCAHDCKLETNTPWSCEQQTAALPDSITVPVVFRDFRGRDETSVSGVSACPTGLGPFTDLLATGCAHPDFERSDGYGASNLVLASLAANTARPHVLVPVYNPQGYGPIVSADTFAQWYADVQGVNRTVLGSLALTRVAGTNTYRNANTGGFFPLDAFPATSPCPAGQQCGFGISPNTVGTSYEHDFGFTSEVRYQFTFQGGEALTFSGDDDVWVFIGGKLAVDLGGIHAKLEKTITLDDATASSLGLVKGHIYEIALFHAERHVSESNFSLTLGGFLKNTTVCKSRCGDGIVQAGEECDLGADNGKGLGCSQTCKVQAAM